jgi:hypothetical protein
MSAKIGRPRKFDLEEEARALEEWAQLPDTFVLREFAAIRGYAAQQKLNEYAQMSEAFHEAFNYAKILIGARREKMLIQGKGNPAAFQRYAALYDPDLKAHEKEMKEAEKSAFVGPFKVEIVDYKNAV